MRSFPNILIAAPGDDYECRACMRYLIKNPQPSYLRLSKNLNYVAHKKIPKIFPGEAIKIFDGKNKNKIYLTTGSVIDYVKKNYYEKERYPIYSIPMWSMKVKKQQSLFIKKFKKIIVVEDHLQDGGFYSWILESLNSKNKTEIISKSFNLKIIGKVGSEKFLMKFLGK
jgi:transketolase